MFELSQGLRQFIWTFRWCLCSAVAGPTQNQTKIHQGVPTHSLEITGLIPLEEQAEGVAEENRIFQSKQ